MPQNDGGLRIDAKTILTVVSMVIAGISAFFAWQIQTTVTGLDMQQRINQLETMPQRVDSVEKSLAEITNGGKQLDVLTELLDRANDATGDARAKASEADAISIRAGAAAGRAEVRVEELQRQLDDAAEITRLLDGVSNLEDFLANNAAFQEKIADLSAPIPLGTVAAFDTTECPKGWVDFDEAHGRFLLGAGQGPLKAEVGRLETGGKEENELTENELPNHTHTLNMDAVPKGGHGADVQPLSVGDHTQRGSYTPTGSIGVTGGGKAFTNMPPYIALYFCKYEGAS